MIHLVDRPLFELAVDAVVRAADDRLEPVGPVSAALDLAAGERFQSQRRVLAPLDVGAAVITGGGDLAAEFVLHIVVQGPGRAVTPESVRRALASAWHRAEGWKLTSVGAALTGLAGEALSAQEAVQALVETFRERPSTTGYPAQLHLVVDPDFEPGTVEPWLGPR